jgi:hypothetical protein
MTFNYELVNKIIDEILPLPYQFGIDLEEESELPDWIEEDIMGHLSLVDPDARLYHGVSKLVIVSPNLGGVVIKIPFNGWYDDGFYEFCEANAADQTDYCLAEYEKYLELKERHLDCFVAKTLLYKKICGVRIFIQEWATSVEDDYEDHLPSPGSRELAKEWEDNDNFCADSEWIANCIDYYGQKKVEEFLNYCRCEDTDIVADLHSQNYGYREN